MLERGWGKNAELGEGREAELELSGMHTWSWKGRRDVELELGVVVVEGVQI